MLPPSSTAASASPAKPSRAPCSIARTVSSCIPARDARSCISSTQAPVSGCPWRQPISHNASRMCTSSHT